MDRSVESLLQQIALLPRETFWLLTLGLGLVGAGLIVYGFIRLHRVRLIENVPTSRVRSAAQGYVELEGHARLLPGPAITAPLSGERCCWWEYRIEQRRTRRDHGRRRTEWVTVDRGRSDEVFVLADTTGDCVIDPHGASVTPSVRHRWRGAHERPQRRGRERSWFSFGEYRYTESMIRYGDVLYALGSFESQTALRAADERAEIGARLSAWKRDQKILLQRFDANDDGMIDIAEWEMARRTAQAEVRREHVEPLVHTDLHVLRKPDDGRPFLLSTRSEAQMRRDGRLAGFAGIVVGLLGGACALLALTARGLL